MGVQLLLDRVLYPLYSDFTAPEMLEEGLSRAQTLPVVYIQEEIKPGNLV